MVAPSPKSAPRALVVLNPAAHHGATASLAAPMREIIGSGLPWTLAVTTAAGEATRIVAACADDVEVVVAVGGDGTVNEVVNGLMERPPRTRPALGMVAAGSGNDFPRLLGVPAGLSAAVIAVTTGDRRRLDVGRCNDRWFVNAVSLGLDAQVNARAVEVKAKTGRAGFPLYFSSLMHVLFRELTVYDIELSMDGSSPQRTTAMLVAACNGRTYGGGFRVAPDAAPDDGLLDTVVLDDVGLGGTLWRLPFFIVGRHTRMEPVHMGRAASLVVTSDRPVPGQVDGEVMSAERYEISVEPGALEVIVAR
jgi:YegS/Rv2252/BmrU family lipid kinase